MLSAALLTDEGKHNLSKKMEELVSLLQRNPTTIMEINSDDKNNHSPDELLNDEKLLTNTLNSQNLHAKAKVIIFAKLDEIERKKLKAGRSGEPVD